MNLVVVDLLMIGLLKHDFVAELYQTDEHYEAGSENLLPN